MASIQYLSRHEINDFLHSLDADKDGFISYAEIEAKLDEVHDELAPIADPHNLHHESRDDEDRHRFLRRVIGISQNSLSTADFASIVQSWKVPSPGQDRLDEQETKEYLRSLALGRRLRAYWTVHAAKITFITFVVSMQIAFGVWQCVKYATQPQWQNALGWGVVLSKTSAGILYPTFFFLILSMSRWLNTFLRHFNRLSRFVNWDLSQEFHIIISVVALFFSSTHVIGHLTGTFLYGSRPSRQDAVAALFGADAVPRPYRAYAASIPGWTGIAAYGIFWIITLTSMPMVRRKNYEMFQLVHFLMFVMIALLMVHGVEALLQWPMLGYFLAFPTLLVVLERMNRLLRGFHKIPATMMVLDSNTVCITARIPSRRHFNYEAGQYILLQIPQISFFQWHPITISSHIGDEMKVHIKTDGNWTSQLHDIEKKTGHPLKYVGIDGPFGAPAQRFKDYDNTIVIGSGIGVTPFAGILADLQAREDGENLQRPRTASRSSSTPVEELEKVPSITAIVQGTSSYPCSSQTHRRVDFHWIVRDRSHLFWFSDLLNRVCDPSVGHRRDCLDIRVQSHVTRKRPQIATHVFRFLLEQHRTDSHPASPLTGLINPTHFGRPDLRHIMSEHYQRLRQELLREKDSEGVGVGEKAKQDRQRRRVGVFFCGSKSLGYLLADQCWLLTLRGRDDRSLVTYEFMMEVFG